MTEEEIMPLIVAGGSDRERAIRAFYEIYGSQMIRFFIYRGLKAEDAQDVFQETLIKIIRHCDAYQDMGNTRAWFWQIARNCHTDFLRKKLKTQAVETQVEFLEDLPVSDSNNQSSHQSVDDCVNAGLEAFRVKEPERVYALSLQMNGLSISEIGERIGRTLSATKEYLSQCRKKLQPFISHCHELLEA